MVTTSADSLPNGKKTGVWLEEIAVPYLALAKAGLAITVAMRLSDTSDLIEQSLASSRTLNLINRLRAHMMADERNSVLGTFVSQIISGQHTFVPFQWKDTASIGWTMAFTLDATDLLDVSTLRRSLSSQQ